VRTPRLWSASTKRRARERMSITWGRWESYPWKNELAQQSERVTIHFNEILSDTFEGDHSPFDMMDRAIVLSAFAIRRLIEKRLVTDRLSEARIQVRSFARSHEGDFQHPFHYSAGVSHALRYNYNMQEATTTSLKYTDWANEIIHASQIMVVYGDEATMATGLLIASDKHLKDRILHITLDEFQSFVRTVLDDRVTSFQDFRDEKTGKAVSKREG
jgi:hypothetical protein